jgi:hypothetical protein
MPVPLLILHGINGNETVSEEAHRHKNEREIFTKFE